MCGSTHQPSPKPVIGAMLIECNLPSLTAASNSTIAALAQNSGATSGSPFSCIEVKVGIVAPGTSSTLQPNPSSKITLSTSAIKFAEAQFIFAIVMSPHSALADTLYELKPRTNRAEISIFFIIFIIFSP